MTYKFAVKVLKFSTLQEVEGAWKTDDYAALLDTMDFGDRSGLGDTELREMCLMSLQDQEPEEAAYIVLHHIIGDDLRTGQLRNIANEMREEKLWEEYVDPAFHARLFTVGSLLYAALPNVFPKTDAVLIEFEVTAVDADGETLLIPVPDPSFIVRLLAGGMDDHAVLRRLYDEQLTGMFFPNAADIAWTSRIKSLGEGTFGAEVISSGYWLDALDCVETYEANAHTDRPAEE